MMPQGSFSPLLYEYLRKYQEDPTSRVFAPLAEAYRKAGLLKEAVSIAKEGLRVHPTFLGGRVALARALFDLRSYAEVLKELETVVQEAPDNLVAQRLYGESCLMLGRTAEALSAYKTLLYFSPEDRETAQLVQELEVQAYEDGSLVLRTDPEPQPSTQEGSAEFVVQDAATAFTEDPGLKRENLTQRVEFLQDLLVKISSYRGSLPKG